MNTKQGEGKVWRLSTILCAIAAVALMLVPMNASAQQRGPYGVGDQYEHEYGQGLHEEEWYDPSDWFDTQQDIDYEQDWYENTYQTMYDEDDEPAYRGYYYDEDEFGAFEEADDELDYYTDTWFEDDDDFDEWYK